MKLSGWGRHPVLEAQVSAPRDEAEVAARVRAGGAIARGNGRAYGDSAISRVNTLQMRHFNRMLAFDPATGQLVAEAGVLLAEVIATFLPRGWFPAVTPGTKFVTLGGMIAADVHGKNHHRDGSFAACVDWVEMIDATGAVRRCSRSENTDLFAWTLGGMGLTGVILRAAIRLRPVESGWIRQTTLPVPSLAAAMQALEASDDATYSMAWIDCLGTGAKLGRALVMLGDHATRAELTPMQAADPFAMAPRRKLSVPVEAPSMLLNRLTVRAFNALNYRKGTRGAGTRLVGWDGYFYPLDSILGWNRIYGRRGFVQFQCALPPDTADAGLRALLDSTSRAGAASFLAVLKRFGAEDRTGGFSFPMPGYTLSLDFPVRAGTEQLMERLDAITLDHAGRFYLAKDARMSARTLTRSDARVAGFSAARNRLGARPAFASAQSERLGL